MDKKNFYITTPIYYVNDNPHIGHAYTTILADILNRYHSLLGKETYFLTGTDEHGQKVQYAAQNNNITPQEQCDRTYIRFQNLWGKLNIEYDDFIRTTEDRHKKIVQKILQNLYEKGEIYKSDYKGRYCVPCERFFTEKDLLEGNLCPECERETEEIIESNYFFKMSNYQDWLINYIKQNKDFIQPSFRANETLGFLKNPLGDLCISRPKSRLTWGIELPFDSDYVCYVWFDALVNYLSGIGYLSDDEMFNKFWPASYHLIGKDILTTHTVYWPIMLKAMGLEMPRTILAHGWWMVGEDKMSKSRGNVVNPMDMAEKYGVDAFRYFLTAEMTLGQDASFTEELFVGRYNTELANDLGNFLNRVVKFISKQKEGVIPEAGEETEPDEEFKNSVLATVEEMEQSIRELKLDKGISSIIGAIRAGNRYMEKTAPWKLAKNGETERLNTVLYYTAEALRIISGLLYPVIPEKANVIRKALNIENKDIIIDNLKTWGLLESKTKINDPGVLFPKIKQAKEKENHKKADHSKKSEKESNDTEGVKYITINDVTKINMKVAEVIDAKQVENKDNLLKIQIKIGEEKRQIVAGIAQHYIPESLIGKLVIVVTNLKPAKIGGIESYGMLLAARDKENMCLLTPDKDLQCGAEVY